jgi:Spherulation-specific family 4
MRQVRVNGPRMATVLASLFCCLFLISATPAFHQVSASTQPAGGLLIPLYSSPGSSWSTVIQEKEAHPSVPMTVVINPDNGPGSTYSSTYDSWIQQLRNIGVNVIGYDPTVYASRSLSAVEAYMSSYSKMYPINGIFLDQMSNKPGYESYYASATKFAHSLGLSLVIGNPGTSVPSSYIGTVNSLVVYENPGLPTASRLEQVTMGDGPSNFGVISYSVSSVSESSVQFLTNYASYIFVTSGTLPDPYATLPSYFHTLVGYLDAILPNAPTSQDYTITVLSVNYHGSPIAGMHVTISYDGKVVDEGFTPLKYSGPPGNPYKVCVSNYESTVFSHWDDGLTSSCRVFGLSHNLELVAAYNT